MNTINRLTHVLTHPHDLISALMKRSFIYKHLNDEYALRLMYRHMTGQKLNLTHPRSFNEKMQWLKLYDRRPVYTIMADKYSAKEWAKERIGEQYIVPTYGAWDNVDDIDWSNLPQQVVLKTNHGYGGVTGIVICKDLASLDKDEAKSRLKKSLRRNYFYVGREWPYKNIIPLVLAEKFLGDNLQDYRVYCFNGVPKLIYSYTNVSSSDGSKPELSYCDIYDTDWQPMPFHQRTLPKGDVPSPKHLSEMIDIAAKLSKDVPFLRVDFYDGERLFLGELTFYPGGVCLRTILTNGTTYLAHGSRYLQNIYGKSDNRYLSGLLHSSCDIAAHESRLAAA